MDLKDMDLISWIKRVSKFFVFKLPQGLPQGKTMLGNQITPESYKVLSKDYRLDKFSIQWMKDRPDSIKHLMVKYPPLCLVRVKDGFICEGHANANKSKYLVVQGYFEDGTLSLSPMIDGAKRVSAPPESFDVVEYCGDMNPEWAKQTLGVQLQ